MSRCKRRVKGEAGVRYIYRVKAINNTISGPNSNRAEVRIPR